MDDDHAASPFARPHDVTGGFAAEGRSAAPATTPLPPSALDGPRPRADFGAPAGRDEPYDPPPGSRIVATNGRSRQPVPLELRERFSAPIPDIAYDPAPGARIHPKLPGPGSPWWKEGAERDPWRDPESPYWLAGPPVYVDDEVIGMGQPIDSDDEPAADSEPSSKKAKRARLGFSALALMLSGALVAGVLGGGVGYWLSERAHRILLDPNIKLATVGTPANRPPGSIADIAKRVSPAVVSIDIRTADAAGSGSGVIIDGKGYILTNNHVVNLGSKIAIRVVFSDRSSATGTVVGTDPQDDLAVIKVDKTGLTVASLGNSDSLAVGDPVVAIGDPLGLRGTVTSGIVSALNRPLHLPGENGQPDAVIDALQTDAAINPGNSGGALVDASGAVVGINTAIASLGQSGANQAGNIGVGFAIPINTARSIAEELIKTGKVVHASFGASSRSVTDGSRDGAYLVQITPGGPAAKAGLKEGDVVTLFNKTLIDSGDALTVAVSESKPGDVITVGYVRAGANLSTKITLGTG